MLDIKLIREKTEEVRRALLKKIDQVDFSQLLAWDDERRRLIVEAEALEAQRNKLSSALPQLKKQKTDVSSELQEMKEISSKVKTLNDELSRVQKQVDDYLALLPNPPADDVLPGGKENNQVLRETGKKPQFDFRFKNHVDLVTDLGLVDYKRGVKLGGNGFFLYRGDGAHLEWALLNFFIEEHRKDNYEFILPPHLLNYECGYVAGQFPKFVDDVFVLKNDDEPKPHSSNDKALKHFLLPTAETALINLHRDETLEETDLPKKYMSYTPCYRKEAGSYRAEERGMIRGHQFNKVEMVQFTRPEDSEAMHEELLNKAERLMNQLGLYHRVSKLAARDCSASMAKTYDIEVWIPSMNDFKEVSSISNAHDFQARRGNIRFKRQGGKKSEFVHTLNASGLATSRLLPAIVEQFQNADGSVRVPEVLTKWLGKARLARP